jgi:hypothetical protein
MRFARFLQESCCYALEQSELLSALPEPAVTARTCVARFECLGMVEIWPFLQQLSGGPIHVSEQGR